MTCHYSALYIGNAGVRLSPAVILDLAQKNKKAQTWIAHAEHLRFDSNPRPKDAASMKSLPQYNIDPDQFWHDPYPDLKKMRETAPIAFVPELEGSFNCKAF